MFLQSMRLQCSSFSEMATRSGTRAKTLCNSFACIRHYSKRFEVTSHPHNIIWTKNPGVVVRPISITAAIKPCTITRRQLSIYNLLCQEEKNEPEGEQVVDEDPENADVSENAAATGGPVPAKGKVDAARHLNRERTKVIPVETAIRYLKSAAYKETYGDTPVWVLYRRNFPGQFAPKRTRKTCIRGTDVTTGNPCPICRDEYLLVHHENVDLLKQFISPYNGEILDYGKTGVCRRQHERLLIAISKAKDYGLITFDVPFREYDYKEYEKFYASY